MNGAVELVIEIGDPREMRVTALQRLDRLGLLGEFLVQFMRDVTHAVPSPLPPWGQRVHAARRPVGKFDGSASRD